MDYLIAGSSRLKIKSIKREALGLPEIILFKIWHNFKETQFSKSIM